MTLTQAITVLACHCLLFPWISAAAPATTPTGKMVFTETLRKGEQDHPESFLWVGQNVSLDVNDQGQLFIADPHENRVLHLNPEGNLIRTIGRKGNGPGEFSHLVSVHVLPNNQLLAFENNAFGGGNTFQVFDAEGTYLSRQTHNDLAKMIQTITVSPNGQRLGCTLVTLRPMEQQMDTVGALLNRDLAVQKVLISSTADSFDPNRIQDPDYWASFLAQRFRVGALGDFSFVDFDQDNQCYFALGKAYSITKLDSNHQVTATFSREYQPIPMTQEERNAVLEPIIEAVTANLPEPFRAIVTSAVIEKAVERAEFPPVKTPVFGLKVTPDGHVLVLHDVSWVRNEGTVDLWSPQGTFLGQFTFPGVLAFQKLRFTQDSAYTIASDQDMNNELVRYRYEIK
jgi:hypothetical protein